MPNNPLERDAANHRPPLSFALYLNGRSAMRSTTRYFLFFTSCLIGLFQPASLFGASFLETKQSVNFSNTSLGADFTIHFSNTSLGANKTIKIVKSPRNADITIGITGNKELATYYFKIVNSSLGADKTINISNTSLGADETIYLTKSNLGVDLNIHFTTEISEADFVISTNKDFLPPKNIIAILSSLNLLDKDNIEIIKALAKDSKHKKNEQFEKHNNLYTNIIESQVDGDFEGWEGETIIRLMNGQIWQQTEYYYYYHYSFMPEVLIYKSDYSYKMKVNGVDKAIGVTRLK